RPLPRQPRRRHARVQGHHRQPPDREAHRRALHGGRALRQRPAVAAERCTGGALSAPTQGGLDKPCMTACRTLESRMPKKATAEPKKKPAIKPKAPDRSGPAYWLFKTEPDEHSWDKQKSRGAKGEPWTGVRNFQARSNMKAMQLGDRGFFYHTGEDKE